MARVIHPSEQKGLDSESSIELEICKFSKMSQATGTSAPKQKQMLITNSSLKMFIPVEKIKSFGMFNSEPQDPEKIFKNLKSPEKIDINKKKEITKKPKNRKRTKKDNLVQSHLQIFFKKEIHNDE